MAYESWSKEEIAKSLALTLAQCESLEPGFIRIDKVKKLIGLYGAARERRICNAMMPSISISGYIRVNKETFAELRGKIYAQLMPDYKRVFDKTYEAVKSNPDALRASIKRKPAGARRATSTYTPSAAAAARPRRRRASAPTAAERGAALIANSKERVDRSQKLLDASAAGLLNPFTDEDRRGFAQWQAEMDAEDAARHRSAIGEVPFGTVPENERDELDARFSAGLSKWRRSAAAAAHAQPASAPAPTPIAGYVDDAVSFVIPIFDEINAAHDALIKTKGFNNRSQGFFASGKIRTKLGIAPRQDHLRITLSDSSDPRNDVIDAYNGLVDLMHIIQGIVDARIIQGVEEDEIDTKIATDPYKKFMTKMESLGFEASGDFVDDIKQASEILKSRIKLTILILLTKSRIKSRDFATIRDGQVKSRVPARPPAPRPQSPSASAANGRDRGPGSPPTIAWF